MLNTADLLLPFERWSLKLRPMRINFGTLVCMLARAASPLNSMQRLGAQTPKTRCPISSLCKPTLTLVRFGLSGCEPSSWRRASTLMQGQASRFHAL